MWSFDLSKAFALLQSLSASDEYYRVHQKRFEESARFLNTHLQNLWVTQGKRPLRVLELAGPTRFGDILSSCCPQIVLEGTQDTELRADWSACLGDAKYDALICMEIVEHLRDLEHSPRDVFESSGIRATLNECAKRLLDKNSILYISTPNGSSHRVLKNVLWRASPFMYNLHVREMSFLELHENLEICGLRVSVSEYVNVWEPVESSTQKVLCALEALGFDNKLREDNMFVVAMLK